MKKLFLLAMAFVAVTAFTGCSKDNDTPEINPELIVGKWQLVRKVGFENGYRGRTDKWDEDWVEENLVWLFNANETGISYYEHNPADSYSFSYSISGDKYTEVSSGGTDTYSIQKLSQSELVLYEYLKNDNGEYSETRYFIRK